MWRRRELLGVVGIGAIGPALLASKSSADPDDSRKYEPRHAGMISECDKACGECASACQKAFHHCLGLASSGKAVYATVAQTMADCAAFCRLSVELLSRESSFNAISCQACAEVCHRCAEACEKFRTESPVDACFAACQRCEQTCRDMVREMGTGSAREDGQPTARP